jgi:hypothetical protein
MLGLKAPRGTATDSDFLSLTRRLSWVPVVKNVDKTLSLANVPCILAVSAAVWLSFAPTFTEQGIAELLSLLCRASRDDGETSISSREFLQDSPAVRSSHKPLKQLPPDAELPETSSLSPSFAEFSIYKGARGSASEQ